MVKPEGKLGELEQAVMLAPFVLKVVGLTDIALAAVPLVPVALEYEIVGTPAPTLKDTDAPVDEPAELVAVIV